MKTPLLALLLVSALAHAEMGFTPEGLQKLDAMVQGKVDQGQHAGAIWLLARDGKILHTKMHGSADLATSKPMQRDTICRIYSMTKMITSVAGMILVEEGKLSLNDPVSKHLPEYAELKVYQSGDENQPQLTPATKPLLIKHLFTHTSGLVYDFEGDDPVRRMQRNAQLWSQSESLRDFARKVAALPLKSEPGTEWNYGINADVLGALIEVVSGMSFETFLQSRVLTPLKMHDTFFDVPADKLSRVAKTYKHRPDGKLIEAEPILGTWSEAGKGIAAGGSGLFSTVDDYFRFAQMLANSGELGGHRVLRPDTVKLMTQNHLSDLAKPHHNFSPLNGWGLGMEVELPTSPHPGAFGWCGAATTYCRIDPKERLVAILLTQHFPFDEHHIFENFHALYYSALQ